MARQNSKYFSSVIEKLIADKHKENIVVAESFKMSLREKVMSRAATMEKMEAPIDAEESGLAGFVNRWKYALALVPSALLVMIVAAQVMNLPVEMKSDVVTLQGGVQEESPTSEELTTEQGETRTSKELRTFEELTTEQSSTDTSEELRTSEVVTSDDGETRTSKELRTFEAETNNDGETRTSKELRTFEVLPERVKKIKTFPGALVMPVTTYKTPEEAVADLDEMPEVATLPKTVNVDEYKAPAGAVTVTPTQQVTDSGMFTESKLPDTPYYSIYTYMPDRTGALRDEDDARVYEDDNDARDVDSANEERVYNEESLKIVEKGDALPATGGGASGDGVGGAVDTTALSTVNIVNPSLAVPDVKKDDGDDVLRVMNISYETALTATEKAALENSVIDPLAEGKEVTRAVVTKDANGYVKVTVYFADGSSTVKTCMFNSARGVWDMVNYVQPVTTMTDLKYRSLRVVY